ncbi:uncharacterized protein BX663DRAFT_493646 [Cokeromyces recurvatus]|uniref:uncharacterized protein n=1 Tax=Cokeromyces recurvatus TaxID=90255 RepID=UPI00221F9B69|nr:uncharacterized protein BX663DRAFT_493646 [Cokeromyces recurvatus]KAI7908278.1 hypothetical protein BX663DRAFT_493646 [Cokeromyces recurvatus]
MIIKNTIIIIVLIILASLTWSLINKPFKIRLSIKKINNYKEANIVTPEDDYYHHPYSEIGERYLTYLPHSGLHNQRIALINALLLAKALNRTLLMPELNIGKGAFWSPFHVLSRQIDLCPSIVKQGRQDLIVSTKCYGYRKYKPVPMESIFDLTTAYQLGIRVESREDMSRDFIKHHARLHHISPIKYSLNDSVRYSYQIHDHHLDQWQPQPGDGDTYKYDSHIDLASLRNRPEPYLEFGSLFGTTRLILREPELMWIREYLHRTTAINHPVVNEQSQRIQEELNYDYVSVHLRQGDGVFLEMTEETIGEIEIALSEQLATVSHSSTRKEEDSQRKMTEEDRLSRAQLVTQSLLTQSNMTTRERLGECLSVRDLQIPRLQIIYLATDALEPKRQFSELFEHYPCIFTLNDFYNAKTKNKESIESFLLPMIDAEVASRAKLFIGTPKSTYSAYVRYRNQHHRHLEFFTPQ